MYYNKILGRKYPNAGYGSMFHRWLNAENPEAYNSFGNGSAMRVSPVGLYANSLEEALELARITASVSHNHPEGIKGAQAIAASIYLKRTDTFAEGKIKRFVEQNFGYNLIRDCGAPTSIEDVQYLLLHIEELKKMEGYVYLHCWGGIGRTGTVVACYISQNREEPDLNHTLEVLRRHFSEMPKSAYRKTPETSEQVNFIERFIKANRVADSIRGCLMAGAAGDALGYEVEFISRQAILSLFGEQGIVEFALDSSGKALISDDTQMTLFTANGLLMGLTRGYMRGIGGRPEKYVDGAYLDWYYTQTGKKREILTNGWHCTWLRDLPEMAQLRAPGNTCLNACESLFRHEEVRNNSKGCGGIMRVAPMALLDAGYASRNENGYSIEELAEAGGEIAWCTHKHPLGFLPASLLTVLLYKVIPMSAKQVRENIERIVTETSDMLDVIYKGEYAGDKRYIKELTEKAVHLAHSDISDADAIRQLGEGWVAEETWAIALYCTIRHIDSVEDAIIASVNHDGDSDSTGSVCGNILGAIYGYEHIKERNIFCPDGRRLEDTLELSEIILALADDLSTGCIISEYDPIDTPAKRQWYMRYCEMIPAGIGGK